MENYFRNVENEGGSQADIENSEIKEDLTGSGSDVEEVTTIRESNTVSVSTTID